MEFPSVFYFTQKYDKDKKKKRVHFFGGYKDDEELPPICYKEFEPPHVKPPLHAWTSSLAVVDFQKVCISQELPTQNGQLNLRMQQLMPFAKNNPGATVFRDDL